MTLPVTPSFALEGRRAVVTGAGRGLGLAIAAALAQAGAEVTLVARSADEIAEAARQIRASGGVALAQPLDVTDAAAVARFFDGREGFDVLVNNAGTNRPKPLIEVTPQDCDAVLDLNLHAAILVTQAAVRAMIRDGRAGSLIHVTSQMGHVGAANRSLYCASKWGLEGFSKAVAVELAPHRIRSNTLAPTFVETPMTRPFLSDPGFRNAVLEKIKLGRLAEPADLMGAAVFLASDAAAFVTGTSLVVDGGWTAD